MQPNGSVHALLATWSVLLFVNFGSHLSANATQKAKNTAFEKTKFQFPVSWSKPIVYVPCKKSTMFLGGFDVSLGYILRCTSLFKALSFPLRITSVLIVIHVFSYFCSVYSPTPTT